MNILDSFNRNLEMRLAVRDVWNLKVTLSTISDLFANAGMTPPKSIKKAKPLIEELFLEVHSALHQVQDEMNEIEKNLKKN